MGLDAENSPHFQERRAKGAIIVKDLPKLDLESYISNYNGFARSARLLHIATLSPYLAYEALHLAITEAHDRGRNVDLYQRLVALLAKIAPTDPLATLDKDWIERTQRELKAEGDKLEHELKSYKNNMIKESIRMGNEDLGHYYEACGDYGGAAKAYGRMREHCTSPKHLADMTLRLIYVTIAQQSWTAVSSQLIKLDLVQLKGEERAKVAAIQNACAGLTQLCTGNLAGAASSLIHTSPIFITMPPVAGITWQKDVMSAHDVAVYGGLCALATMDRAELQSKVLGNPDFRNFLELEPHIRRAITLFCKSKYSACLEVLEGYRSDYMLDLYLSKAVTAIYNKIRTKSVVQYFIPFSCVTLEEMASKFQVSGSSGNIEEELEQMISEGVLDARIDLVNRLLVSPLHDPRHSVHSDALSMAQKYEHTLHLRLTRLNLLQAGLTMSFDKSQGGGQQFGT
ncbi:PCI-domain-containing protein [Sporormia fimetaria CBS 119925]|uniref:PCI-domain-containing protein n=1 Tax=Sporormia fimetaria CBS 119925 TaxID=1340428 RepID=A0A6A6VEE2_9PLEO|nr:PCI-domain-containing protein [Sporormia fimetaria CBS 119925]